MFGTDSIRSINEGNALRKRALAYATNHPGTDVVTAMGILAQRDARAATRKTRVVETVKAIKRHAKRRTCCT